MHYSSPVWVSVKMPLSVKTINLEVETLAPKTLSSNIDRFLSTMGDITIWEGPTMNKDPVLKLGINNRNELKSFSIRNKIRNKLRKKKFFWFFFLIYFNGYLYVLDFLQNVKRVTACHQLDHSRVNQLSSQSNQHKYEASSNLNVQ